MKKEYNKPEVEVVTLKVEDIITTSNVQFNPNDLDLNGGDSWYGG